MATQNAYPPSFLIIGSGRLARHLQHYFHLLNIPFEHWDRSQDPVVIQSKILKATHILLAISDSAIEAFFRQKIQGLDKITVHFSGALHIEGCISAHPLMTFADTLYDLDFYQKIFFTLCGVSHLHQALPLLPNPHVSIMPEQKPYYHAMCVLGGNFSTVVAQKMILELKKMNIPSEACGLYLQGVLQNVLQNPESALTGPLARKDSGTVQKNLEALSGDSFLDIYQAFLKKFWPTYPQR